MSKKFKSTASSSRVQPNALGGGFGSNALSTGSNFASSFGAPATSQLSYVYEPPDLTAVSEPSVVVSLKNVQKKDGTTKARALDELLAYLARLETEKQSVEDGVIEAWIKLYARTSIDNARQVRQRAHNLQGRLTSLCGKRIVKSLPSLVGPWLCGLQDNDKLVARSAQEAFAISFSTEEKRAGVWKVYHKSVLEYCSQAILNEDAKTLSDERTTNEDDADSKYTRTLGSAILTLARTMENVPYDQVSKEADTYISSLDAAKFWSLASSKDSFARQAVYSATLARLKHMETSFSDTSLKSISSGLVGKALRVDQSGSSTIFAQTLASLTSAHPEIWTKFHSSKKRTSAQNLEHFLRNLPVATAPDFWSHLGRLFEKLPEEAVEGAAIDGSEKSNDSSHFSVLEALRQGMTRREHLRAGQSIHWKAYLILARRLTPERYSEDSLNAFAKGMLCPLAQQFVLPEAERSAWSVTDQTGLAISMDALLQADSISAAAATSCVSTISSALIESMQTSLPEQAKGFKESQARTLRSFERWSAAKLYLLENSASLALVTALQDTTRNETNESLQTLKTRNGKPFGAVGGLQLALSLLQKQPDEDMKKKVIEFLTKEAPALIGSPSTDSLLVVSQKADEANPELKVYETCLANVLKQPNSPARNEALVHFVKAPWPLDERISKELGQVLRESLQSFKKGDSARLPQLTAALANESTPSDLTDQILLSMVEMLSIEDTLATGLQGLSMAAEGNQRALRQFLKSENSVPLAPKLLLLSQPGDGSDNTEMKRRAGELSSKVQMLSVEDGNTQAYTDTLLASIQESLEGVSLSVAAITDLARQVLKITSPSAEMIQKLLPAQKHWLEALKCHLMTRPDSSISITNEMGGSVFLVDEGSQNQDSAKALYDSEGLSIATRTVKYLLSLTELDIAEDNLALSNQSICYVSMFNQLATDNLSTLSSVPLWKNDEEIEQHMTDLASRSRHLVNSCVLKDSQSRESVFAWLYNESKGTSIHAYYAARSYVALALEFLKLDPTQFIPEDDELTQMARNPTGSMQEAALFATAHRSASISKLVNGFVAELAWHDFDYQKGSGLKSLILLNRLVTSPSFQESMVTQKHRLVMFVKHVVTFFPAMETLSNGMLEDVALMEETLVSLRVFVPLVKDVFDEFWEDLVGILIRIFESKHAAIAVLHAALRFYSTLAWIAQDKDETNEDFVESWPGNRIRLQSAIVKLMCLEASNRSGREDQPQKMVYALIGRYSAGIVESDIDTDSLYPVLSSQSESLQTAAFTLLHRKIPTLQEKITMDAALVKDFKAKLPADLLTMVQEPPTEIHDLTNESQIPSAILGYVLAWKLIFDHWEGASYQVQNNYVTTIKESGSVRLLVELIFDYTITSRLRPLDASKFSFERFELDSGENPEKELIRQLCHLYLLTLKHTPGLVRAWWRDDCVRSLQRPAEEWTEKHMSPLVVAAELAEVSRWAPAQETDTPLEVRVSVRAREVTAAYPVDEQMAAMRVALPANYPLAAIAAEDVHRVGVDERKWRAWLVNAAGVMNFAPSSGGLGAVADGLAAWRRNVTGTLRGQSECAICYSIVNADRQLPTKRCGTCKNAYHGTCLFRWFKSSGGSSCPLCRNPFNYG